MGAMRKPGAAGLVTRLLTVFVLCLPVVGDQLDGSALTDRQVLELLYSETSGSGWSNRTNRLSDMPLSDWFGVVTDETGQITRLNLASNQLSGPIPTQLATLTSLQKLGLGDNQLSGTIPPGLSALTDLRKLALGFNQLSGSIPTQLSALTDLLELELGGNQLSGAIPPQLAALTSLQTLDLGFNPELAGVVPSGLRLLPLYTVRLIATKVCLPENAELQRWFSADSFTASGLKCGRPAPAMSSIDVAVLYTSAARSQAGGTAEMEAKIDLLIAEANQAYADSGYRVRIRLGIA